MSLVDAMSAAVRRTNVTKSGRDRVACYQARPPRSYWLRIPSGRHATRDEKWMVRATLYDSDTKTTVDESSDTDHLATTLALKLGVDASEMCSSTKQQ